MIYSQISVCSLFTGCRCPSPWEFYSRVALILSLPSKDDLIDEVWPCFKVRRESEEVATCCCRGERWAVAPVPTAMWFLDLGQGRLRGLDIPWEWNFHWWQHVVPFATGIHCRESSPSTCHDPWTGGNDLDNCMGLDFNGFQKPWQCHMEQWSVHAHIN